MIGSRATVATARGMQRASVAALVAFAWCALAFAADVPYLTGRVVDNAEILKPATREQVDALLKAHESATSDQIAVLTTRSLAGESIEQYAQEVFAQWKLGQKGKDNGILVVVAPSEHKMRIEVGYGLEGTLPDIIAARIIRNIMTPAFKGNDYDGGVQKGAEAIVAQLEGRGDTLGLSSNVADQPHAAASFRPPSADLPWPMRILMGCFVFGIIGVFTVIGVMTPGMGWFLYLFLIPFWAMFPLFIIGPRLTMYVLGIYVIGFPIAKLIVRQKPWYAKAAADLKKTGHANINGWVISSGGSSSGGGGSSGSSGGGFSGGGGSSGGGGASGSW
ncbi:MAG: TPM domain-containing protein [Betaproteobacteria bacterium]